MFHLFNKSSDMAAVTQMLWDDILPKTLSYLSSDKNNHDDDDDDEMMLTMMMLSQSDV